MDMNSIYLFRFVGVFSAIGFVVLIGGHLLAKRLHIYDDEK